MRADCGRGIIGRSGSRRRPSILDAEHAGRRAGEVILIGRGIVPGFVGADLTRYCTATFPFVLLMTNEFVPPQPSAIWFDGPTARPDGPAQPVATGSIVNTLSTWNGACSKIVRTRPGPALVVVPVVTRVAGILR
jgi:hypothetical protein